ncbi:MAG: PQQ-dependent dehydrogenase, methanol/ethanol family [Acidobacteria bacterium]|nr:PQQ-dependent dehydrogenase, methanol/ethanol family [Acidobacteriota bacterium]
MRWTIALIAAAALAQDVTFDRLKNALKEQQNWMTYHGDYSGQRHRTLKQINSTNVKDLRVDWIFQTGQPGEFQGMPLVVDGVMYLTSANGVAFALDARSGRQLWRYSYPVPKNELLANGTVNRGFAILGNQLFMVTPDCHLLSLDARTGELLWNVTMEDNKKGYGATLAPLVVGDKVIAGVGGGEYGIRGFIAAFDARSGKEVWKFYTIPAKGEKGGETWLDDSWQRGGGPAWMTGTYDPQLNTLYWSVGNPGPDLFGDVRQGDNLYTCSVLALDPNTGKLKWHFQFTPHDTHDWDANQTNMLVDMNYKGQARKLLLQANRNGFHYVLDRVTGEFLSGKAFAPQTWAVGLDEKGRPIEKPGTRPSKEGTPVCPGLAGATNWMAPALNPETGWFYFAVRNQCDVFYEAPPVYVAGKAYWGSVFRGWSEKRESGSVKAMDPISTDTKWEFPLAKAPWSGVLSTGGQVIFATDLDGYIMALESKTGALLWKFNLGYALKSSPITWEVGGRQYITMGAGSSVVSFALPKP